MADADAGPDDGWAVEGGVDDDVVLKICRLTDGHCGHVGPDDGAVEDRRGGKNVTSPTSTAVGATHARGSMVGETPAYGITSGPAAFGFGFGGIDI